MLVFFVCFVSAHADILRRHNLTIREFTISVEVADTPSARQQGLMYRKQLPTDEGMLFIFSEAAYHGMWMLNTRIALSVAFVDEHGVILNIADMEPLSTEHHSPVAPAKYVLEMNRGWFTARGIKARDQIRGLPLGAVAK